ncbi:PREDICTED: reverse mRNAase [Prunus dulcis]|uniref:PREDICTED: reverse mRNAase n=1 Tax=Prunus dulcis TaxID=3755 RepID=A0A5E4F9F7_PRUDU|nr:PREDICTED: reverse mRNAase [Prunus dulcis]
MRSIHWLDWPKLCQPKCFGGLGFKNFEAFNKAMVAKQSLRLLEDPSSLLTQMMKARYFRTSSFLQAKLGSSPSLIWRALLWGRDVLHDGFVGRVGNGNSIRLFHNKWIPKPFTFKTLMNNGLNWDAKVADLFTSSGSWNLPILDTSFCKEDCDAIASIDLGFVAPLEDGSYWLFSKNGK